MADHGNTSLPRRLSQRAAALAERGSSITVAIVIPAEPAAVWAELRDLASHVEWMADAEAIRFTSERREGIGTSFDCDTKVGPIRLTDKMEVTEWVEGRVIGVRHVGVVTGSGRFTLVGIPGGASEVTWSERLTFPWWLGGPAGGLVARPVLAALWRGNLRRLKERIG